VRRRGTSRGNKRDQRGRQCSLRNIEHANLSQLLRMAQRDWEHRPPPLTGAMTGRDDNPRREETRHTPLLRNQSNSREDLEQAKLVLNMFLERFLRSRELKK
jgi:hypothetical protein